MVVWIAWAEKGLVREFAEILKSGKKGLVLGGVPSLGDF